MPSSIVGQERLRGLGGVQTQSVQLYLRKKNKNFKIPVSAGKRQLSFFQGK
jgi:hypothetical protein